MRPNNASLGTQAEQEQEVRSMSRERDSSPLQQYLARLDIQLDNSDNTLIHLEERLKAVLSPGFYTDGDKTLGEPSPAHSPLICELDRLRYRMETLNQRLSDILENLEL